MTKRYFYEIANKGTLDNLTSSKNKKKNAEEKLMATEKFIVE